MRDRRGPGPAARLPAVIAHRGHAEEFPENTLESVRSAISHGAGYVEFDVQMSGDGVPIVIHDADLKRTGGLDGSVMDLPLSELKTVDVGEAARFGERFRGTRIPTLSEMVDLLAAHSRVTAFVEIKEESLARFGAEVFVPKVLETIEPIAGRSVIISFESEALAIPRGRFPIGWVVESWARGVPGRARSLRPDYLITNHRKIPAGRRLWTGSWRWVLYEVGDPTLAPALRRIGADFIETMAIGRFARHPLYRETLLGPV